METNLDFEGVGRRIQMKVWKLSQVGVERRWRKDSVDGMKKNFETHYNNRMIILYFYSKVIARSRNQYNNIQGSSDWSKDSHIVMESTSPFAGFAGLEP